MNKNELILDKYLTCRVGSCPFHLLCSGTDSYHAHFILNGIELVAHLLPAALDTIAKFMPKEVAENSFAVKILDGQANVISQGTLPLGQDVTHYNLGKHLKKHRQAILSTYMPPLDSKKWA